MQNASKSEKYDILPVQSLCEINAPFKNVSQGSYSQINGIFPGSL